MDMMGFHDLCFHRIINQLHIILTEADYSTISCRGMLSSFRKYSSGRQFKGTAFTYLVLNTAAVSFWGGDIPVRCKTARNTQVVRILCASRCSSAFARFECQKSCSESCISKKLEFLNMTGDCGSQNPQFRLSPCLIFRPLPNFTQTPPVNGDCVEKVYQNYMPQF